MYNLPVPYSLFIITFGILASVVSHQHFYLDYFADAAFKLWLVIEAAYFPAMLFSVSFCVDIYAFVRAIYQILLLSCLSNNFIQMTVD